MKRVLVLNADSYVGQHVVREFYASREYEVEVTLSHQDDDLLVRDREPVPATMTNTKAAVSKANRPDSATQTLSIAATLQQLEDTGAATQKPSNLLPKALKPYVSAVLPRHNAAPDEFCQRVLENDIIIAVLDDDHYEAECAIKVLLGSHYEVEKTFVLVSSCLTWAHTLTAERWIARMTRRREREAERAAFMEDAEEDEELPEELQEPEEEEEDEELVPSRVFTDDDYVQRVAHPRFQHWKELEHMTKRANSETLHTYVLFAGMPYGYGEGPLHELMRSAWFHQTLPLYGPGKNVVPMIHVHDLATIIYKVGSSYDTLEERYMFAVDRGNITQRQLLDAISRCVGGKISPVMEDPAESVDMVHVKETKLPRALTMEDLQGMYMNDPSAGPYLPFFLTDVSAEPSGVFGVHDEESWMALDGFAENIDKVIFQFREHRNLKPQRIVVTGPPLAGTETLSAALSDRYRTPYLTIDNITADYESHVADIRKELHGLLAGRLQRRRDRAHALHCKEITDEKARLREEARERREARRRREEDGSEEGEEGQEHHSGEEEEDEGDEEEESEEEEDIEDDSSDKVSELSVAEDPPHRVSAHDMITERYLLGASDQDAQMFEEDEEIDEDAEEALFDDEDDDEGLVTKGHLRARAAMRARDLAERIRIQELRLELRVAMQALSMKTTNGHLPKPPNEDEEEEEEEEEDYVENTKGKSRRRRGSEEDGGSSDDEEGSEEDEEGQGGDGSEEGEEGEEEDEEGSEGDSNSMLGSADDDGRRKRKKRVVDTSNDVEVYLDEALAFFARWRLRQPDCTNQGYVLHAFPKTVRQACLLFYAETPEESELRPRRVLPPTTVEDVLPPKDSDFPFADLLGLDDEARAQLEAEIRADRLRIVDPNEEGVLSAVQESTFPDFVVILDEKDEKLQMLASALQAQVQQHQHQQHQNAQRAASLAINVSQSDTVYSPNFNESSAAAPKLTRAEGSHPSQDNMTAAEPQTSGHTIVRSQNTLPDLLIPEPSASAIQRLDRDDRISELLAKTAASATFYPQLDYYRKHHNTAAPPTDSLVTWLQSVNTTEVVGATPPEIVLHAATGAVGGDEDGEEDDEEGEPMDPPALTRMTQVLILNAPPRDVKSVLAELGDVLPILLGYELLGRMLASGNKVRTAQAAAEAIEDALRPLQKLAERLRGNGLPNSAAYGPPLTDDLGERRLRAELKEEEQVLSELLSEEHHYNEADGRADEDALMQERLMLRHQQLREECIGAWDAAGLPMESYIMKYVLPSLTPTMAEIVRRRPEDPVTALADILFHYHRRVEL